MPDEMSAFDKGLGKMGNGIRRAQAGYTEADEGFRRASDGFRLADEGFIEALEALKVVTLERGTLDERFKEMRESIARLEALVLEQSARMLALQERLDQPPTS
jgi:hypothetical protein